MIITANNPIAKFIHVFLDGKELHYCVSIDTKLNETVSLDLSSLPFTGGGEFPQLKQHGKITFKLERVKQIPEPFFTELTTDKCFAGFID